MSSKNNPETRGELTELRMYKGKPVKPVKIINREQKINFIGAAYESGEIVMDPITKRPIPYQKVTNS